MYRQLIAIYVCSERGARQHYHALNFLLSLQMQLFTAVLVACKAIAFGMGSRTPEHLGMCQVYRAMIGAHAKGRVFSVTQLRRLFYTSPPVAHYWEVNQFAGAVTHVRTCLDQMSSPKCSLAFWRVTSANLVTILILVS